VVNSGIPTVTGGTSPYTFSVVGTLPAGLTLNTNTGAVTGTPTAPGSFSIQVKDANGVVASGTCPITIIAGPSLSCTSVTGGEVGVPFNSGAPTVTGGTSPYTFSVVGTLPAGLTLNTSTGAVTGTPTAPGSFSIQVKDANGIVASGTCPITIIAGPSLSCTAVTSGEVGVSFNSGAPTVTGGMAPYTFSVVGTLPAGLTLNTSTGAVTGTPTAPGSFSIQVKDANGVVASGTCPITIIAGPSLSCTAVTSGEVGVSFNSGAPTVTGGTLPYTFSIVGTLPAGLTLNTSTGAVTGTPTAPGSFSIQVKDANGIVASGTCPITIIASVSATCVNINAVQGIAITPVTLVGSGGSGGPYTFTATGLPSGLSISSGGTISGTPTVTGTFNYTVTITDAAGHTGTLKCSVTVVPPVTANCGCTTATEGVAISPVTLTGSGGSGGPYTFTATGLPAGLTLSSSGVLSGTPTVSGTFSYTVTVTDNSGHSGTVKCSITVSAPPPVTSKCVCDSGKQGVALTPETMVGSGGVGGPYTFTATGLPAGVTISSSGTISGTPTVSGTFNYTVTVTDAGGNKGTVNCTITITASPICMSCVTINAAQGSPITPVTLVGSGGAGGPYTFSATGLPAGLTISSSGTISGTPTVNGTFNYTVTVTDSKGNKATFNCSIKVCPPVGGSSRCADGQKGHSINPVQVTGSGGAGGPYTFKCGSLPPGLSISSSGVISGTPTSPGNYNYKVTVYDSQGNSGTVDGMSNISN
ncbi:MAG: putative Ig domain-containing protein, partial [Terracidiphilus sp.]